MTTSDSPAQLDIAQIIDQHGRQRQHLLPILRDCVGRHAHLNESSIQQIAQALGLSATEVYGTATFFAFLPTTPVGSTVVRLCKNISCHMEGKDEIVAAIEEFLHLQLGQSTPDGRVTFVSTNCLGWCHQGPAMLINGEPFTGVTPAKAVDVLRALMDRGEADG